jgi:hypothetical protein
MLNTERKDFSDESSHRTVCDDEPVMRDSTALLSPERKSSSMFSPPRFFPILSWLPNYKKSDLGSDVNAGVIVFVLLIPQGMVCAIRHVRLSAIGLQRETHSSVFCALYRLCGHALHYFRTVVAF